MPKGKNGTVLLGKRFHVDKSLKQHAWHDTFDVGVPVEFNGPITEDLIQKAVEALKKTKWFNERQSSWGALHWLTGRSIADVLRETDSNGNIINVTIFVTESWGIAD